MFTPVDYDFSAGGSLRDYGLELSKEVPFETVKFDGNKLRLVASEFSSGELIINTDAGVNGVGLKLKVKNLKGNATTGTKSTSLVNNEYVKTDTVSSGVVIITVNYGETFEFTGYSLIAQ